MLPYLHCDISGKASNNKKKWKFSLLCYFAREFFMLSSMKNGLDDSDYQSDIISLNGIIYVDGIGLTRKRREQGLFQWIVRGIQSNLVLIYWSCPWQINLISWQNFAHAMTALLSRHVQRFVMINLFQSSSLHQTFVWDFSCISWEVGEISHREHSKTKCCM